MVQDLDQLSKGQWHGDLFSAASEGNLSGTVTTRALIMSASYLPPKQGDCDLDVPTITALSSRSSHLEILKYAVHMVTNSLSDTQRMASMIVELAQRKANCESLRGLFCQKLLIMDAFAEKL
jgi:hypothetical protein